MKLKRYQAADRIGIGRHTYARYEAGEQPIPAYVALACQAIANGLPPMK